MSVWTWTVPKGGGILDGCPDGLIDSVVAKEGAVHLVAIPEGATYQEACAAIFKATDGAEKEQV